MDVENEWAGSCLEARMSGHVACGLENEEQVAVWL